MPLKVLLSDIIFNVMKTKCIYKHSPDNQQAICSKVEDNPITGYPYEFLNRFKTNCNCTTLIYVDTFKCLGLTIDRNFN